jgi:hypothetical protein
MAEKPKSRRWLVDSKCKKLGWVMVPVTAGDDLARAITKSFDKMEQAFITKKIPVHESLLDLIERLETNLIEKLCELANGWRKTRITKWQEARTEIVSMAGALTVVLELLDQLFDRLHTRVTDYTLIDTSKDQDKLVFLELECLEEKVIEDVAKIVKGWK